MHDPTGPADLHADASRTGSVVRSWRSGAAMLCCALLAAGCAPRVHIATQLELPDPVTPESGITADLRVSPDSIAMALTNVGSEPVEVLWQKTVMVDSAGHPWEVEHGTGRGTFAALTFSADDVSVIAPGDRFREVIRPRRRADVAATSEVAPFTPIECGPVRCVGYETLLDKTVRLAMTRRRGVAARLALSHHPGGHVGTRRPADGSRPQSEDRSRATAGRWIVLRLRRPLLARRFDASSPGAGGRTEEITPRAATHSRGAAPRGRRSAGPRRGRR